ncbi:MAG: gamma-glutamylcyclotransferase, partial [Alphaproteobacteria bacterium]|nr:gamma-glutamylcyclotransferase [Alphaproteobacteria bacterium]
MRFFFYGTLLDADLRRAVCGTAADGWASVPAALADHRGGRSAGLAYPFLLPAPGESVEGLVVDGIDAEAAALLTLYEGEGYRCERCR